MEKHIVVIGGGASGLTAAISAKRENPSVSVTVLEKNPRVAKKILVTGNGRCNLANKNLSTDFYYSDSPDTVESIFNTFGYDDIIKFFESIGIVCKATADGLVYPRSMQASSISDALRFKAESLGAEIFCDAEVSRIIKTKDNKFEIYCGQVMLEADSVIIATGSKAGGGSGTGIKLMRSLAHSSTAIYPALSSLVCDTKNIKAAAKMRAAARASLYIDGKKVIDESGEIMFTDYGLSGIAIMQLSGIISRKMASKEKHLYEISLDLAEEYSDDELYPLLSGMQKSSADTDAENFLSGFVNKRVGICVLKASGINPSAKTKSLTDSDIKKICDTLKDFKTEVTGIHEQNAQVYGGGISLEEFDPDTLESKLCPSLYGCGEVMDVYGKCGGYNLSWAWASGYICGRSASRHK